MVCVTSVTSSGSHVAFLCFLMNDDHFLKVSVIQLGRRLPSVMIAILTWKLFHLHAEIALQHDI